MTRILLLGPRGQIGWELQRALAPVGAVVAVARDGPLQGSSADLTASPLCGDLERLPELEATLRALRPGIVVNAAAYTAVDDAERETETAHRINAAAPERIAAVAREIGAWLVHFSTDYVFDGSGETPWREDDVPRPLNVYGRTKQEGEAAIRASGCRHLILRTGWVHSARGRNFPRTILRLAQSRKELRVVADQFGAPTGADLVADVTAHLVRMSQGHPELGGTYHVAARGETSRLECARFLIDCARASGWSTRLSELHGVPAREYQSAAPRPRNCRLDCGKLEQAFGLRLPGWQDGLRRLVEELGQSGDRQR